MKRPCFAMWISEMGFQEWWGPNLQNLTGSFWSERQHRSFMSLPHREDNKYHPCHEAKCLSYISRSWAVSDVSRAKVQGVGPQGSPRHGARQGPPEPGVSYGFEATAIHRSSRVNWQFLEPGLTSRHQCPASLMCSRSA